MVLSSNGNFVRMKLVRLFLRETLSARDWINVKTPSRCYITMKKAHLRRSPILDSLAAFAGNDSDLEMKVGMFFCLHR